MLLIVFFSGGRLCQRPMIHDPFATEVTPFHDRKDTFHSIDADANVGLLGHAADMRCDDDFLVLPKWVVGRRRLDLEGVRPAPAM